jgi:orotate phosphoribosyltransferase
MQSGKGWISSVQEKMFAPVELSDWKKEYVDFLTKNGVLQVGNYKLKSGRMSPIFLDYSRINDGEGSDKIGHYFAQGIQENFPQENSPFVTIVAPSYKGNSLSTATSINLARDFKRNVHWTNDRKEEKAYGEGTDASKEAAAKRIFLGYTPQKGNLILLQDDVLTTGQTKDDEKKKLDSVVEVNYAGLILGGNRQEVDIDGNNAVEEFGKRHNMPVRSLVNVLSEAIPYLSMQDKIDEATKRRLVGYTRAYGTEDIKKWCRDIKFLERDKGLIPACDVPFEVFGDILEATHDIPEVVAYKLSGLRSGRKGWETWVETAKRHTDKPLILDYQKAGNDIPDLADDFMSDVKGTGFDAIIIFPFAGGLTHSEWTRAAFENDLEVLAGAEMTQPNFTVKEGGYISDEVLTKMFIRSARYGVNNFVVPGNKVENSKAYVAAIKEAVPGIKVSAYSPGLVTQGGEISAVTENFDRWYAILGRGVTGDKKTMGRFYTVKEMRESAFQQASKLK